MSRMQALASKLHTEMSEPERRRRYWWVPLLLSVSLWLAFGAYFLRLESRMNNADRVAFEMSTALQMTQTAVVVADADGIITAANAKATEFFERDTLLGLPIHALCVPDRRERADEMFHAVVARTRASGRPSLTSAVADVVLPRSHKTARVLLDIRVVVVKHDVTVVATITPEAAVDFAPPTAAHAEPVVVPITASPPADGREIPIPAARATSDGEAACFWVLRKPLGPSRDRE